MSSYIYMTRKKFELELNHQPQYTYYHTTTMSPGNTFFIYTVISEKMTPQK